jgi:cytidylate kinase
MRTTITIARQLGSGGSVVGQHIAQSLGIRCIDREIVSHTAQQFQMDEKEIATREEKVSSFWERIISGIAVVAPEAGYVAAPNPTLSDQEIFESETQVLKTIAQAEDCVIIGRAAAHVLAPHPGMFNILLHAPLSFRVPRVMDYYHVSDEGQARAMIKRSDGVRAKFIAQMAGCDAADARNYHLSLDSSLFPLSDIADLVIDCVRRRTNSAS